MEAYFKYKEKCVCNQVPCAAANLCESPKCKNVLYQLVKVSCKDESGVKPIMLKPICDIGKPNKKLEFAEPSSDEESDFVETDSNEEVISSGFETEQGAEDERVITFKRGDC